MHQPKQQAGCHDGKPNACRSCAVLLIKHPGDHAPEGQLLGNAHRRHAQHKQQDMQAVLESMGDEYGIKFTPEQEKRFVLSSTFGVPIRSMQKFLDLPEEQRDKILKNEGIPCDSVDNQFKSWVRNARAANADLRIAIKADASTPYSVIKNVMNSLQDLRENRYNLITSLKVESED